YRRLALPLPDPGVLIRRQHVLIVQALLVHRIGEPGVVAPVELQIHRAFGRMLNEALPGGIGIEFGIERDPYLGTFFADGGNEDRPGAIGHHLTFFDPDDIGALEALDTVRGEIRKSGEDELGPKRHAFDREYPVPSDL